MTATAEVDHLSTKAWWEVAIDDAAFFLTSVAGQRTNPPTCGAQPRPNWIEDALFLDEQNAPLRVCTGVDPNDPDIAVVTIKNNRGGAMVVTAPVTPTWAAVTLDSTNGSASSAITDILTLTSEALGVSPSERTRSWVLPPGSGVDIGFTRDSLAPMNGIAPITAKFSTASATYGLVWKLLSGVFDDPTYLTAFGLGLIAVCANDSANDVLSASNPVEFGAAAAQIAKCGVESGPTIIKTIERLVSRDVWKKISGTSLNKLINTAKSKLLLLTAAEAAVTDLLATLALDSAAFTITIFTAISRRSAPKTLSCSGRLIDQAVVNHPSKGAVRIYLLLNETANTRRGCVVAVPAAGPELVSTELFSTSIDVYGDSLNFASPPTDATGNTFVTYNPGRYNGVLVLIPSGSGFAPIGWEGESRYMGRLAFYFAELQRPGADGRYSIVQSRNDCRPDCAGGTITTETLQWDGNGYVP